MRQRPQLVLLAALTASTHAFVPLPLSPVQKRSHLTLCSSEVDSEWHDVHWLADYAADNEDQSLGEAIAQGEAVVCLHDIVNPEEYQLLYQAALAACDGRGPAVRGRSRFSVSDPEVFRSEIVLLCDEILLRVLDHLDDAIPSIHRHLFVPEDMELWADRQPLNAQLEQPSVPPPGHLDEMCDGLRELYMMGELEWSEVCAGGFSNRSESMVFCCLFLTNQTLSLFFDIPGRTR